MRLSEVEWPKHVCDGIGGKISAMRMVCSHSIVCHETLQGGLERPNTSHPCKGTDTCLLSPRLSELASYAD